MERSNFNVMKRLVVLVKPLRLYMAASVAMGTIGHLCATFIMIFACYGVLRALNRPAPFSTPVIFIGMVLFALIRAVFRYGEQGCNHYIAFRLLAIIRDHVFKALRRLAPAKLEGRDKGDLISLITSDVELLEVFYAHTISPICIAVIYTVIMTVFISRINIKLGLLALFSYLAVGIALPIITSARAGDDGQQVRERAADLSTCVLDSMRGLAETIRYGNGDERLEKMLACTDDLLTVQENEKNISGRNMADAGLLIYLFDTLMLAAGIILYWHAEVGFADVLISTVALMSSFGPVTALAGLGSTLQNTLASGNRVLDILDEEPVTKDVSGLEQTVFTSADADHVSFAYEGENVLQDFSLQIPAGKITGIVGKSGSGKSTFLKLLMRFWQTDEGAIHISDKDIDQVNTADLRNMESYMTQETYLFHDTVKNNLLIAKPDAADEEIYAACRKASIHDFIVGLPAGYETQVGELGDTLSEGEKQRIGLARAFLHEAPLILLDEPTSNLDSLNEAVILKALKEENGGKTVVLVSHRQSTMKIADKTVSVEHGRVS